MKETPKHPARAHTGADPRQQALGSPVSSLLSQPLDPAEVREPADPAAKAGPIPSSK